MNYLIVVAFALFGAALAEVEYDRPCRFTELSPRVKSAFQVSAYLGTWYENRRYEAFNQPELDCSIARYTLNADGSVQVANSGYSPNGTNTEFIGRATVAFPDQVPLPAKLDVSFFPGQTPVNYWILATDYFNYAFVWSCTNLAANRSREQFWVLSRTPELSAVSAPRVEQIIDDFSINRSAIRMTSQDLGQCRAGGTPV